MSELTARRSASAPAVSGDVLDPRGLDYQGGARIAFGERHPTAPWRNSVYTVAGAAFHGA